MNCLAASTVVRLDTEKLLGMKGPPSQLLMRLTGIV